MTARVQDGDPGIDLPLVIDGVVLSFMPKNLAITPDPVSDYLDMMDGGAQEWQRRPFFDGIANHSERYTFAVPYDSVKGDNRVKIELIRARGGTHRLTLWRKTPVIYTCLPGLQRYYFPRFRKCAAHIYAGLLVGSVVVSTEVFPTTAELLRDGVATPLNVTYGEGPALADPGPGAIVIAREPDTDGETADYTAFLVGTPLLAGDVITLWSCFSHDVSMRSPSLQLVGLQEHHAYTFVEV